MMDDANRLKISVETAIFTTPICLNTLNLEFKKIGITSNLDWLENTHVKRLKA